MRVFIQWARGTPQDWESVDLVTDGDIRSLPKRDRPAEGDPGTTEALITDVGTRTVLDVNAASADDPGWLYDVSIQGVSLSGADVLHMDMDGATLVVTRWNDDPEDWTGDRFAQVWRFGPLTFDGRAGDLRPAPGTGLVAVYAEGAERRARYPGAGLWSEFSPPGPENKRRYGIWQTDANVAAQEAAKEDQRGLARWRALGGS